MRKPFTLVELLIAMSVLSVFLLGLMQFYTTTEDTMSSCAARTELYERARIAMDMMANDLTCMFCSTTDKTMKPIVSDSTDMFRVSTVRPEKLDPSGSSVSSESSESSGSSEKPKTSIIGAKYRWDSSSRTLKYATNGFDYLNAAKTDGFSDEETLIDGVTYFSVEVNYGEDSRIPDSVLIRMELVDGKTMKRLEANDEDTWPDILEHANRREFRRLVIIDRGQRKYSSI